MTKKYYAMQGKHFKLCCKNNIPEIQIDAWGLPLIMYAPRCVCGGGGVKSPIYFHCVLYAKRGEGVQIASKIAYVLMEGPYPRNLKREK